MLCKDKITAIFCIIDDILKEICPVEVCKNIRINRSKIVKGEQWRGYTASMRAYSYKHIDNKKDNKKKTQMRKRIEVTVSDIKKMFARTIHSVTLKGFLLKVILYVFINQLNNII